MQAMTEAAQRSATEAQLMLLQSQLEPRRFASFQTGVQYQVMHAFGLLIVGLVACLTGETASLRWSARLMLVGIVLFSGAIYLMTAGAPRWLGMIAPVGGVSFMAAWALLARHALARAKTDTDSR